MISQRQTAKSIFLAAIEKHPPHEWPAFLDEACVGDEQLRADVNKLLRSQQVLGSFHETPPPHWLPPSPRLHLNPPAL
jgi:hypothetical protein